MADLRRLHYRDVGCPRARPGTDQEKKVVGQVATTVIIPARNEERTIGEIVRVFQQHPQTKDRVFIGIDSDTNDKTAEVAKGYGGIPIRGINAKGKGQVVYQTLKIVYHLPGLLSGRIILCDADYTGLTTDHIDAILRPITGMVIGIPDWPDIDAPPHVFYAWPRVSGFRCIPFPMVPPEAHGYLLETQLNLIAERAKMVIKYVPMDGLKSPFQWPLAKKRMEELERDRDWGTRHGVL